MAFFSAVKNVPSLQSFPCATTLTVTKGVPVRLVSGVITICATNVLDVLGIPAETHVSGGAATINVIPAVGKEGPTIFKIANATIASTSCGVCYFLQTVATNSVAIHTASTTLGAFMALTADGTDVWGVLSGNQFQGALSLTA